MCFVIISTVTVWPNWLNWIEHQTSNLGVAGSSPALGVYDWGSVPIRRMAWFDYMIGVPSPYDGWLGLII